MLRVCMLCMLCMFVCMFCVCLCSMFVPSRIFMKATPAQLKCAYVSWRLIK